MLKILYITTGLNTGGAEMMLYKLLSRLDREQFNPVVLSLIDQGTLGERILSLGVPIYTLDMKQGSIPNLTHVWKLIRIVHQCKPDLIQGWMNQGNLAALVAKYFSFQSSSVIWGIRGTVYSLDLENRLTAWIIQLCAALSVLVDNIIYVSHVARKQHEVLGFSLEKGCVIPNGFEIELFNSSLEARHDIRCGLGLRENTFLIGLICRYHPMKDHSNFFHAAALLLKSHPDVHFILVGTDVDTKNKALNNLIQDLGIYNRVHLLGERRDVNRITASLDIASSASAYGEGFPNVIGEAMSCCVPCVATDIGDSAWIIGDTGITVPPRNSQALANAWKEIINLDPEQRGKLGKAARLRIVEHFSLDFVVNQYEALYRRVLKRKNLQVEKTYE